MDSLKLGASMYVPCTHECLVPIGNGKKYQGLRSVIYCLEDAVSARELEQALFNLEKSLPQFDFKSPVLRFVRVRNPDVLKRVLSMAGIEHLEGFVLPKVTADNVDDYFSLIRGRRCSVMITLETRECFDDGEMIRLRNTLIEKGYDKKTLSLRIGGNDLLNVINMRRIRGKTIYETPIGHLICRLVGIFKPYGFQLSAPVCEYMNDNDTLNREIDQDLAHGLVGKTAIHPSQIDIIEKAYRVSPKQVEEANYILSSEAKAVYKMHDAMLEVATHSSWAKSLLKQADIFGVAA